MTNINSMGQEIDEQTSLDILLVWRIKDIAKSYDCELESYDLDNMIFSIYGKREDECSQAILDKLTELSRRGGVMVSQCPAKASRLIPCQGSNPCLAATRRLT